MRVTLEALECEPLSVPLVDPFVIASGQVETTRSVWVRVRVRRDDGREAVGMGEGSCLPPVTQEDQPDTLLALARARPSLEGASFVAHDWPSLHRMLDPGLGAFPVARSGVEMALLDATARLEGVPLFQLLGGPSLRAAPPLETDITLPILSPERMAKLARHWWAKGFRAFKIKVGRSLEADLEALGAICAAIPGGTLRVDANGGYEASAALRFLRACEQRAVRLECFEQPCAEKDFAGLAQVAAATRLPVVVDESVKQLADLEPIRAHNAARGVNLKVAKSGGLLRALEVGQAARRAGMVLMVGGMVETRLGMTAAAHLTAALGGVELPDLDTAWLLQSDPFRGGYTEDGPRYTLGTAPGLGVERV